MNKQTEESNRALVAEGNGVVKIIKFMNDYDCTSLWWASHSKSGPIEYDELPLSSELVELLETRDEKYNNTLNWEDPSSTQLLSEEKLSNFEQEGITLWRRLQEELKPYYFVTFFSEVLRREVNSLEELKERYKVITDRIDK